MYEDTHMTRLALFIFGMNYAVGMKRENGTPKMLKPIEIVAFSTAKPPKAAKNQHQNLKRRKKKTYKKKKKKTKKMSRYDETAATKTR